MPTHGLVESMSHNRIYTLKFSSDEMIPLITELKDVMHALNQTWHMQCFVCATCGKTFQDGIFHWQNEKPYCVDGKSKKVFLSESECDF